MHFIHLRAPLALNKDFSKSAASYKLYVHGIFLNLFHVVITQRKWYWKVTSITMDILTQNEFVYDRELHREKSTPYILYV